MAQQEPETYPVSYTVRLAENEHDIHAAQALRAEAFKGASGERDQDEFDKRCTHFLIENKVTGALAGCFRVMLLLSGRDIHKSYSAQFYDLGNLDTFEGAMAEIGRFCTKPGVSDANVLRVAWASLARYVDENAIEMLFGCSSFAGTIPDPYLDAFALLQRAHVAPACWRPVEKSPRIYGFERLGSASYDRKMAFAGMPPLLRSYLLMGGWVSDHAVIDLHMNTMHVFTGLEIASIPASRKALLRRDALMIA